MKRLGLVLLFSLGSWETVSAQWLNYPSPGTPRTADGRPNLSAAAPRTADGKVDLAGVWLKAPSSDRRLGRYAQLTPWAARIYEERAGNQGKDNPSSKCLP